MTTKKKIGRPTKERQLQKAIEKANSKELTKSLQSIRLKIIGRLAESSDDDKLNKVRAEDVKNLYSLWKSGKEVLTDLLREEAGSIQKTEEFANLLDEANSVTAEMGWDNE